jgi:RNA polymerase sigma-70 factor (ECF subfamily)
VASYTMNMPFRIGQLNSSKMNKSESAEARKVRLFEEQAIPLMPQLYGAAMNMTKNPTNAEDLLQETMVKAFKAFNQFEQGTNIRAWLYKIMNNTNINVNVKAGKALGKTALDDLEDWQIGGAESVTSVAARSAEAEAIDAMPSEVVKKALLELPENWRMIVYYRIVDGLSYAEIAEVLDIPEGSVMSGLHRGKKLLRTLLMDYAKEEGYKVGEEA